MKRKRIMNKIGGAAVILTLLFASVTLALTTNSAIEKESNYESTGPLPTDINKNQTTESPWPMFRHDLKHTGYTPYTGPATPTLAWNFTANDGIVSSPSIGSDGTIYVGAGWYFFGANDHNLYALNPNGSLKWSYEAGDGFFSSPALGANNTLYITSLDGYLYAIEDKGTYGEMKWRTYLNWGFSLSSPAIGSDGTVYVGSPSFNFYAIHPDNGSIIWSWHTGWCIISSPAISDDGIVYIGSKDHYLYAFDDSIQGPAWQFPTGIFYDGHLVDSSPAIGADGTIYFGTDPYGAAGQTPIIVDTNFWAVNPDGTLKWSFDTEDGVESSPAIGPDGTIYFGSYDNYFYAITDNGSEGVLQWKFPTNGSIDGSPTVDGEGTIYFGSRDSTLYALYPDGTVKWTFVANDGFECSPTIDGNGYLYIGSFDGNLYALGTGAPDVGVVSIDVPNHVLVNTTYIPLATMRNYRAEEQSFNATCTIKRNNTIVYNDTILVTLSSGSSSQQSFAPWLVGQDILVNYTITVTTILPTDDNFYNNERSIQAKSFSIKPDNPSPGNGATKVPIDADLSWTCGDPYGDTVTYDVYFGNGSPPPKVVGNQTGTSYDPGTMNYNTTYYWKIVAWYDFNVSNESSIWSFTTMGIPPEISNVTMKASDPLDTEPGFGWENFSCTVTDNDGVDEVKLVLIGDITTEYPMNKDGDDYYYCNITISTAGEYTYHIWADDTSNNFAESASDTFALPLNVDVDMDGKVHFMDLVAISLMYNEEGPNGWVREDVDNGGKVHFMDLVAISQHYNEEW